MNMVDLFLGPSRGGIGAKAICRCISEKKVHRKRRAGATHVHGSPFLRVVCVLFQQQLETIKDNVLQSNFCHFMV
jgi:hypothetical protein